MGSLGGGTSKHVQGQDGVLTGTTGWRPYWHQSSTSLSPRQVILFQRATEEMVSAKGPEVVRIHILSQAPSNADQVCGVPNPKAKWNCRSFEADSEAFLLILKKAFSEMFLLQLILKWWFSAFSVHQNHLEEGFQHRLLGPIPRVSDSAGWAGTEDSA